MNGVRPAWFRPLQVEEADLLFKRALNYGRIAVVQGPASSGKRETCKEVWRLNVGKLTFDEFECIDFSLSNLQAHVGAKSKIRGAFSGELFRASAETAHHLMALYDLPVHGRNGLSWLLSLQRRTKGVGFVVTTHRGLLHVLPGGFLPPDAFLAPLVLSDWTMKNIKTLWETWPEPWTDLAKRMDAGEKDAIASANAIVDATAGRQGQLAAFAEYWEKSFLQGEDSDRDAYHRFPLEAIRQIAELLFPLHLVGPDKKRKDGPPNQTKHGYLPGIDDLMITVKD